MACAGQTECGKLRAFASTAWFLMSYPLDLQQLAQQIKQWGRDLGFQQVGICDTDLRAEEPKLQAWLDKQYHGEMAWMARHGMSGFFPNPEKSSAWLRQPLCAGSRLSQSIAQSSEKARRNDPGALQ